ncbi:unnamed protein product, partial [Didymodactylos carnosus]
SCNDGIRQTKKEKITNDEYLYLKRNCKSIMRSRPNQELERLLNLDLYVYIAPRHRIRANDIKFGLYKQSPRHYVTGLRARRQNVGRCFFRVSSVEQN